MSVIFLDIDGVLVTRRTASNNTADPVCVIALNRIIEHTGAGIVLISSWRYKPMSEMIDILFNQWRVEQVDLFDYAPNIKVISKKTKTLFLREHEIAAWIHVNDPIYSFVIIDDDKNEYPSLGGVLISPEFDTGLTIEQSDIAIDILNGG